MWNGDELQLDEYLAFIGFDGDRSPTLETLRRLQRGHVLNIKWENLDAVLHKNVALDIPAVQAKLLRSGAAATATSTSPSLEPSCSASASTSSAFRAGCRWAPQQFAPPPTACSSFGLPQSNGCATSDLAPAPGADPPRRQAVVADESWTYQLRRGEVTPGADGWTFSEAAGDGSEPGWLSRHTFVLEPQYPIDYRAASYFVASSPHSPFSTRAFVQQISPDHAYILDHRELHEIQPGVGRKIRQLTPAEVLATLREIFGIELGADDSTLLLKRLAEQ